MLLSAQSIPTEGGRGLSPPTENSTGSQVSLLSPPNSTGDIQAILSAPLNPTRDAQIVSNALVGQPSEPTSQISITAIPVDTNTVPKVDPPGNPVDVHSTALSNTIPQLPQETMEHQQQFGALEEDPFWPAFWSSSVPVSEMSSSEAPINYSLAPMDLSTKQKSVSALAVAEEVTTNEPQKSEDTTPKEEIKKTEGFDLKQEVTANTSAASEINVSCGMSKNSPAEAALTLVHLAQVSLAATQDDNRNTKEKLLEKVVTQQEQEQLNTHASTSTESTVAKSSTESPDSIVLPGIGDQSTSSGNISAKTQVVPPINDVMEDDETSEFLVQQYLLQAYIKRLQNHQSLRRTRFPFPIAELLKSLDSENELNKATTGDCSPGNAACMGKTTDENMNSGEFGFFSRLLHNYYNLQKERSKLNEQPHRDKGSTSGQLESSCKTQQETEVGSSSSEKKDSLNQSLENDLNAESLRSATPPRITDVAERDVASNQQISHQQNQGELMSQVTNAGASSQGSAKRNLETVGTKEKASEGESPAKKQKMILADEAGGNQDQYDESNVISTPGSTNELPPAPSTVHTTDTAVTPHVFPLAENQTIRQPQTPVGVKTTNQYSQGNSIKEILDEPDTISKSPMNTMQLQTILLDKGVNANSHLFKTSKETDNPVQSELRTLVTRQQVSAPTEMIELDVKLPQDNIPVANAGRRDFQKPSGSNNATTQTSDSEDVPPPLSATSIPPVTNVLQAEILTTQQKTSVKMQQSEETPQSFSTTAVSQTVNVPQTQTLLRMKDVQDAAPSFAATSVPLFSHVLEPETLTVQQKTMVKMNQNKAAPPSFHTTSASRIVNVGQLQTPTLQSHSLGMKEMDDTSPCFPTIQASQIINVSLPQAVGRMKQTENKSPPFHTTPMSQVISVSQPQTSIVQKPQTLVSLNQTEDAAKSFPTTSTSHVISVSQPLAHIVQKAHTFVNRTEDAPPSFPTTSDLKVITVPQPQTQTLQPQQTVVKTKQLFVPTNSKRPQCIANQAIFAQNQQTNRELKHFEMQRTQLHHQQRQQLLNNQQFFQLQQQEQHQPRFSSAPQNLSSLKPIPLHKIVELHHQQRLVGPRQQPKTAEAGGHKLGGRIHPRQITLNEQDAHSKALKPQAKRHNTRLECQYNMSVADDTQEQIVAKLAPTGEVMDRAQVPNQNESNPERPLKTITKTSVAKNLTTATTEDITKHEASEQQQQQQQPSQFNPEIELKTEGKKLKETKPKSVRRKLEVTREESPKNKFPKETIKKKWKLAPDSQQKEGITRRLRFQKDNQNKKVSPPRTPYTRKLRSAQAQKEKRTYGAFWNENDEIIKDILSESESSDSNDNWCNESRLKAIVQGMDEEDMTKKKRKHKKKDETLEHNRKVDVNDNIGDSKKKSEAEMVKAGNPNQAKFHCEECGDLLPSQDKLDDHVKSHEG